MSCRAAGMRLASVAMVLFCMESCAQRSTSNAGTVPDLNGIWQAVNSADWDLQDHGAQSGVPAGQSVVDGNEIPYTPAAAEQRKRNFANRSIADPESKCDLPGVPRATYLPFPFQIVQAGDYVAIAYEYTHALRIIYMDGSSHPEGELDFWMGDSRGHWEGNSLVVDVKNLNDQTWFDRAGNFHSDALHVVERYTPTDADHLLYEARIEDQKTFTRPWTIRMPLYRRVDKNMQLLEYECVAFVEADARNADSGQRGKP